MAANFGGGYPELQRSYGYSMMTCIVRVDTRIPGWQSYVRQVLNSIDGVRNFKIDPLYGVIQVSGTFHSRLLLDMIQRAGGHAQLLSMQHGDFSTYSSSYPPQAPHAVAHPYYGYTPASDRGYGGGDCSGGVGHHHAPVAHRSTWNRPFGGLVEDFRASSFHPPPGWL